MDANSDRGERIVGACKGMVPSEGPDGPTIGSCGAKVNRSGEILVDRSKKKPPGRGAGGSVESEVIGPQAPARAHGQG